MAGLAVVLEGIDLQPAVVHRITGGPDDGADAGLGQVEFEERLGQARRVRQHHPGFGFLRQVQAVAGDVGVGGVEQRQVVFVAAGNVLGQVGLEADHAVLESLGQADQGHALVGQPAKVHGMPATGTADGDGHVLLARLHGLGIPLAQHPQPPAEITVAVGPRRAVMGPDRKVDLLAGALQLIGDLHPRGARPYHQHRAFGQLLRVAVGRRMHLQHARILRGDRRDHRALERTGGHHHLEGFDHPVAGVHGEARAVGVTHHLPDFDAGADRCVELAGVGFEVVGHLLLAGKGIGVQAFELQAGKAVVPGRAVGHQRIPAPGAPGFGDTVAFQHQVRHAQAAQVFAHGHAGLAGAHYKRIDCCFMGCHVCALLSDPT